MTRSTISGEIDLAAARRSRSGSSFDRRWKRAQSSNKDRAILTFIVAIASSYMVKASSGVVSCSRENSKLNGVTADKVATGAGLDDLIRLLSLSVGTARCSVSNSFRGAISAIISETGERIQKDITKMKTNIAEKRKTKNS